MKMLTKLQQSTDLVLGGQQERYLSNSEEVCNLNINQN